MEMKEAVGKDVLGANKKIGKYKCVEIYKEERMVRKFIY